MNRTIYFLIILTLMFSCENDDDSIIVVENPEQLTFIWQGFYHDWTYNHRVNRMGDWISDVDHSNGYKANFNHSAASGIGADELSYMTFTSVLRTSANVNFQSGMTTTILQGIEGSIESAILPIEVILEGQHDEIDVLLNGFDMFSRPRGSADLVGDGQADKLFHFEIRFENLQINYANNTSLVEFDLYVALGSDCTSPECSSGPINDFFDYEVSVGYQVIGGNSVQLNISEEQSIQNNYNWEQPMNAGANEIHREDHQLEDQVLSGQAGYDLGVAGISSIYFQNEKGFGGFDGTSFEYPHMLNFDFAAYNSNYDVASGNLTLDCDLFFKNWRAPVPPVSYGSGGSVEMVMGMKLIQIKDQDGIVEGGSYSNSINWTTNPFNPSPPNIPASIKTVVVDLNL